MCTCCFMSNRQIALPLAAAPRAAAPRAAAPKGPALDPDAAAVAGPMPRAVVAADRPGEGAAGRLVERAAGRLVERAAGRLVEGAAGRLVERAAGRLVAGAADTGELLAAQTLSRDAWLGVAPMEVEALLRLAELQAR